MCCDSLSGIILFSILLKGFDMASQNTKGLHKVFVYGTLKKEEPNHSWFSKEKGGYYKFLYEAKTKEKYPLIIGTKYNIPFLLHSPGSYFKISIIRVYILHFYCGLFLYDMSDVKLNNYLFLFVRTNKTNY